MRWRFLLLMLGLTLIVLGVKEIALWRVARGEAAELSCKELGTNGPGDNAHIELSDFMLLVSAFVYEERGGRWTVAWVPAVPDGSHGGGTEQAPAGDVRVLVKMSRARSMADVVNLSQQQSLVGMVVNEIETLGPHERAILERHYPGVDFEQVQIFELGRRPASLARIISGLGIGVGLVVFVLWTLLAGAGRPAVLKVSPQHVPVPKPAGARRAPPGRGPRRAPARDAPRT